MNRAVRESEALRALGAEPLIGSGHEDEATGNLPGTALPAEDAELLERIGSLRCLLPSSVPLRLVSGGVAEPRASRGER